MDPTSSAISTSAATAPCSSGIGRQTSFRSRGRTGSDASPSLGNVAGRQGGRRLGGRFASSHGAARAALVDATNPPSADTAHIDVDERPTATGVRIEAGAAYQLRIACLDPLDCIQHHLDVREVYLPVPIQVRHLAVPFLVDIDIGGIAELVPAIAGASLAADGEVVGRGSEPRANPHTLCVHAVVVEVVDHQLELVQQRLAENDVLRPDVFLVVGDEVPQPEMLGDPCVFVLGCDFDEPVWILVGFRSDAPLLLGPVAESVAVQPCSNLLPERAHGKYGFDARAGV